MKKVISYLIIFVLFITMFPVTSLAQVTDQRYSDEQMKSIVQKYENNEKMLTSMFCNDSSIGYWSMVNDIKENKILTWALDVSSKLIDEYPKKQDYAEILANLITMQSGEFAEQIETQSRFDDLKNKGDYAWDLVEIATAIVGASDALETLSTVIGTGVNGVSNVIIKNNDQAKYYEATLQDYSQSFDFLSAISQYAENEELRDVASSLLDANDALLAKRLEYLADAAGNIAEYEAKFFVENMSMELLKEADLYAADETVKWFVDEGIHLKSTLLAAQAAAEAAFKITIFAGDIGFGTSDVYKRYQEMKVVADIASSLVKANEAISIPQKISKETLETIQEKCNYYKALLITHARGEYLLYQLLMNDAGAVSDTRWIKEFFKNPEDTTDAWYESQIEILTKYSDVLNSIFAVKSETITDGYWDALAGPQECITYKFNDDGTVQSGFFTDDSYDLFSGSLGAESWRECEISKDSFTECGTYIVEGDTVTINPGRSDAISLKYMDAQSALDSYAAKESHDLLSEIIDGNFYDGKVFFEADFEPYEKWGEFYAYELGSPYCLVHHGALEESYNIAKEKGLVADVPDDSTYIDALREIMKGYQKDDDYTESNRYYRYDLDQDNIDELIIQIGNCEMAYEYLFFDITSNGYSKLGEISAFHSSLRYDDDGRLYRTSGHMGDMEAYEISETNQQIEEVKIYEGVYETSGGYVYPEKIESATVLNGVYIEAVLK